MCIVDLTAVTIGSLSISQFKFCSNFLQMCAWNVKANINDRELDPVCTDYYSWLPVVDTEFRKQEYG